MKNNFYDKMTFKKRNLYYRQLLLSLAIGGIFSGCQKKSPTAEAPVPDQTPELPETQNIETSKSDNHEIQALPEVIIAEVALNDEGQPIPGTGSVRTLDNNIQVADGASAALIWNEAQSSTDIPTDELETSTSSWSPIPRKNNQWDQYQPAYQTSQGQCYSYGQGQSYAHGSKRYYVFYKQNINTNHSQLTVPICGGYGGYQPYPQQPTPPAPVPPIPGPYDPQPGQPHDPYDAQLRAAFERYGVRPLSQEDYLNESEMMVALGEKLFNDKLLSAKNDISCATCHVERKGTSDGYSLGPIGEVLGGRKRGPFGVNDLLPRNSPHLFNAGHKSFQSFFWDGRVEKQAGYPSGIKTPAGNKLPDGLNSPLAAQALFPLIAEKEMGCGMGPEGHSADEQILWQNIIDEVLDGPGYSQAFRLAYPGVDQFGIEHLVNAIAAFESKRWRTLSSRFDRYISGQNQALSPEEKQGAVYFYTKGNCAQCHSGPLLTDHGYHNIGLPQFGPGAGDGIRGLEDFGRGRVTNRQQDRYRFKTPSLRNVSRNGPWGHDGAYNRLEDFVSHYRNPVQSFERWNLAQVVFPQGFQPNPSYLGAWTDGQARRSLLEGREVNGVPLSPEETAAIVKFLYSLSWEP